MKAVLIFLSVLASTAALANNKIIIEVGSDAEISANVPTQVSCRMPIPQCKIERTYRNGARYYQVEINHVVRSRREISGEEAAQVAAQLRVQGECK